MSEFSSFFPVRFVSFFHFSRASRCNWKAPYSTPKKWIFIFSAKCVPWLETAWSGWILLIYLHRVQSYSFSFQCVEFLISVFHLGHLYFGPFSFLFYSLMCSCGCETFLLWFSTSKSSVSRLCVCFFYGCHFLWNVQNRISSNFSLMTVSIFQFSSFRYQ